MSISSFVFKKKSICLSLYFLGILFLPFTAHAFNYHALATIPILNEGRIKPLDSFARIALKKIHGETHFQDRSALMWLTDSLFMPQKESDTLLFPAVSPEVASILALPGDPFYSFRTVANTLSQQSPLIKALVAKDTKLLTAKEQEILHLYDNMNLYAQILGSFSLLMPLGDNEAKSYVELLKDRPGIDADLKAVVKQKGDKIEQYTSEEQHKAEISYRLSMMQSLERHNTLLRIIPPAWENKEEWLSPWGVMENGEGSPRTKQLFLHWQQLIASYQVNNAAAFNHTVEILQQATHAYPGVRPFALWLEVQYNAWDLLTKSLLLYMAGALVIIVTLVHSSLHSSTIPQKQTRNSIGKTLILLAISLHALALFARIIILMRPPVSTLYESMIFVSLLSSMIAAWLEHKKAGSEALLVGSLLSALLLAAANIFAADSDTLEVLVAVLNTNFWLATHVICITTGYSASLIAGAMGHIYLVKRAFGKSSTEMLRKLQLRLHSVAVFALLFTAVGTMLGGIWADQSWGRFWGWDPKENGALWIVLWLIWLLHGRIAGQIRDIGFAAGLALITIVVALAWVGVNLLSVGLHSYGFTNAAANSLLLFCSTEVSFIGILVILNLRRRPAS